MANFNLKKQFCILEPNLPTQGIFDGKQKKETSPMHSAYSKYIRHQYSL